jgi:hypothetical protein
VFTSIWHWLPLHLGRACTIVDLHVVPGQRVLWTELVLSWNPACFTLAKRRSAQESSWWEKHKCERRGKGRLCRCQPRGCPSLPAGLASRTRAASESFPAPAGRRHGAKLPDLHTIHRVTILKAFHDGIFVSIPGSEADGLIHHSQISRNLSLGPEQPKAERYHKINELIGDIDYEVYVKVVYVCDERDYTKCECSLKMVRAPSSFAKLSWHLVSPSAEWPLRRICARAPCLCMCYVKLAAQHFRPCAERRRACAGVAARRPRPRPRPQDVVRLHEQAARARRGRLHGAEDARGVPARRGGARRDDPAAEP